jgi:hypothetical protein
VSASVAGCVGNPAQEPFFGSQVLASVGTYRLERGRSAETQTAPAGALQTLRRVAGVVAYRNVFGHVERTHMGQDQMSSEIFILAFVFLAAFFGSIAVALGWLG